MEILKSYSTEILGAVGVILGLIIPKIVTKAKVLLTVVKGKIGSKAYAECESFVLAIAKLNPENFLEDKVSTVLEVVNKKFGNHLTPEEIQTIVNDIANLIKIDITKAVA